MPIILSIISGVLLSLSFEPHPLWPLAWIALVPFFMAIKKAATRKKAFLYGILTGAVFYFSSVYWIVFAMNNYGDVALFSSTLVLILLVLYLSLYFGVFALLFRYLSNMKPLYAAGTLAAAWVSLEVIRGFLFTGFPWMLIGYSQAPFTPLIQVSSLGGVWLVSFLVVFLNLALYFTISSYIKNKVFARMPVILGLALIILSVVFGMLRVAAMSNISNVNLLDVGILQGNIDQATKWDLSSKSYIMDKYAGLSTLAAKRGAKLIIWPETALPFTAGYDNRGLRKVKEIAKEGGAHLFIGSSYYGEGGGTHEDSPGFTLHNSAFLFSPEGEELDRYDKVHLVPFGEYVPLRKMLFFIDKLTYGVGDYSPGLSGFKTIKMGNFSFGTLICYEAIFPNISAKYVREGADFLINITNDGWFGDSPAPHQHFAMSRFRSIETGVPLVRSANTGISAVILPTGEVLSKSLLFTDDVINERVLIGGPKTFFTKFPMLFPLFCFILSSFAFIIIFNRNIRGQGY